jgi:hypothetical protein
MRTNPSPFLFFIACLLPACNTADIGINPTVGMTTLSFSTTATAVPTTLAQPIPTNTTAINEDCFLVFHIGAWQDINGNGLWGSSEPPLEGVKFDLHGVFAELWGYPYLSGEDGWVTLETWSPGGCREQDFTIIAGPPVSYEPTTPASITISISTGKSPFEAQFGFRAVTS